ncbi:MAG: hypothetical protein D6712_00405 [Chloroflexi bacterium]|nr:MAG: hypothetical protein D6712_00405 [Chloroflexota bacterium]
MEMKALLSIRGIGQKRYQHIQKRLKERGQNIDYLLSLSAERIKEEFGLPIQVATNIVTFAKEQRATSPLQQKNIAILTVDNPQYPQKLKTVLGDKAPNLIYVWGNLELLNRPTIGFCGSRNTDEHGLSITRAIIKQLAPYQWVVVSGHARGVDTIAHRAALEAGLGTIIVLPEGILTFKLRDELKQIARPDQLLIISEFEPEASWQVWRAMKRNQTIVALAEAMVLVQAGEKGGTFEAGKTALRLKKPLFVVEFEKKHANNSGNQHFLSKGAYALKRDKTTLEPNISAIVEMVKTKHKDYQQLPLLNLTD